MPIIVEPLKTEELDEFINVFWVALEPLEVDMITMMIWPNGLTDHVREKMRSRILKSTNGDPGSYIIAAKEPDTGRILGVARWEVVEDAPNTREEIEAKIEETLRSRREEPVAEGMNDVLANAFTQAAMSNEMEIAAGRKYLSLHLLAIHPSQQRRGVGTLLLKQIMEKADRLNLPMYILASISGRPLYERFGFETIRPLPLDCRDYGGRSEGRHWCMLRSAKVDVADSQHQAISS